MFSHSSQPPALVKYFTSASLFGPRTNVAIGTIAKNRQMLCLHFKYCSINTDNQWSIGNMSDCDA